jgi:hypothetical protein
VEVKLPVPMSSCCEMNRNSAPSAISTISTSAV